MNWFKIKPSDRHAFVYDQAVIVEIDFAGLDDFGTISQKKEVDSLKIKLESGLPENAGVDGSGYGDGTATIYLYGPDAQQIYDAIEPTLKQCSFEHVTITLQFGLPDNPSTTEKKFSL